MKDLELKKYDVLVVGAGPAGVSLGINLGKKNISTLIVEQKAKEKIGKKTCGDGLGGESIELLANKVGIEEPKENEICERLDTAYFSSEGKFEISIPFESRTIDRLAYGQRLLKELEQYKSVDLLSETKIVGTLFEGNKIGGCTILANGKKQDIKTKIVADCSGTTAIVRKFFKEKVKDIPHTFEREEIIISCREIIKTQTAHQYQKQMRIETHPELPPPGYFWIFSKGERKLNIGCGWLINEENKHINPNEVLSQIRDKIFSNYEILESDCDTLPGRLPLYNLVHDGFITCGDAGGLVNPISGEGHGPALVSGYYAAQLIEKALKEENYSKEMLWPYNVKIWKKYGVLGAMGVAVQKLLNAIPFEDFEWLFENKIITQKDVNAIMESTSNKPAIFPKLIKFVKKPYMLIKIAKMLLIVRKIQKISLSYPEDPTKWEKWEKKIKKIERKKL